MQADLIRDFNAISSQILATLLSFWLWLCKRVAALAKTYGLKFTKPALHYVAFFLPGPWMLLWAWQLPEYNVAKKMQHKLPQMLGGDALPSFISNPLELALAYLTLVVGVFAVVELGGLVLAAVRGALCPAKAAPVAVAVAKEGAAEGEAVEEAPQRSTYSLSGLLKLAFLQGYCQLVLFCTDSPSSTFSAKYSLLAPLGITFMPSTVNAAIHLGLVLSCLGFFGYFARTLVHGVSMSLLFAAVVPFLTHGDSLVALMANFK